MSDGLPTDEQLRRIERGVLDRIDTRRRIARGIAGTTAGVVLLAGGIALLVPLAQSSGSGGSTAAGGGSAASARASSAEVDVRCRLDDRVLRTAAPDDADSIAESCGAVAVDFQSSSGRMPVPTGSGAAARPTPSAAPQAVVCRADDGVLEVLPAGERPRTVCERAGLQPY